MWTIGVAYRLRFPSFPSELGSGKTLGYAQKPTGSTVNNASSH